MPDNYTASQLIEDDSPEIKKSVEKLIKIDKDRKTIKYNGNYIIKQKEFKGSIEEFDKKIQEIIEEKTKGKKKDYERKIKKIQSGEIDFPQRNTTNNRLDHLLTGFPKKYLRYCTLEHEKIVEYDMVNAQFCLLGNYIDDFSNPLLSKHMDFNNIDNNNNNIHNTPVNLFMGYSRENDTRKFIDACKQGRIYELAMNEIGVNDRKKFKNMFMGFMFGNVKYDTTSRIYLFFEKRFRNVISIVNGLKMQYASVFKLTNDKKLLRLLYTQNNRKKSRFDAGNDYLPIGLQRCESEIFVDNILVKLQQEKLTVISKHDSILCKESEADRVEAIIIEELDRILGANNYSLRRETITKLLKSKIAA
ncbi:MAG: hypothetical protein IPH57_10000 [Saprospiraceae bacterium]|nr:hypothetical protein [Saprospiraceae bacterium]